MKERKKHKTYFEREPAYAQWSEWTYWGPALIEKCTGEWFGFSCTCGAELTVYVDFEDGVDWSQSHRSDTICRELAERIEDEFGVPVGDWEEILDGGEDETNHSEGEENAEEGS